MKETYIRIRCSQEEKSLVRTIAESKNLSMSQYLLILARKEEKSMRNTLNELTVGEFLELMTEQNAARTSEAGYLKVEEGQIVAE